MLAKLIMDTAQLEEYNPNYIGGDINGGLTGYKATIYQASTEAVDLYYLRKRHILLLFCYPPGEGAYTVCVVIMLHV